MIQEHQNNKFKIYPLKVLTDNIVWIWVLNEKAVVVDPSIALPVMTWLEEKRLSLIAILQTHHHEDHIGGTKELLHHWPKAEVIASKADLKRIPFQTISVEDQDELTLNNYPLKVMEIPGHTTSHIAFHLQDPVNQHSVLFCGDTLFSGGCGRLFEGTPKNMFLSINRINKLPAQTQIYCGHEYTESNLKWANNLCPEDSAIKKRLKEVVEERKLGKISLPTTLEEERKINLFIRAKTIKEFSYLREHKDNWAS